MARYGDLGTQYFDDAGDPLVSGKIYFYETGTTTPKTTYADVDFSIPNSNPVILTAAGRQPNIFFDGVAKAILTTASDTQILVRDPVGDTANSFGNPWIASKRYASNDVVQGSDGQYYVSLINGNVNNNPVTTTGNWTFLYSIEWSAGTTYKEGSVITYQSLVYQSLQNANLNKDPLTQPAYWTAIQLSWISTVTYSINANVVASNGVLYTSLQNANTNNPPASSPAYWVGTSAAAAASATAAAASASAASTSATAAAASASTATTQASNAASSASTATTQAGIATTQAGIATTQAGIATTQASAASSSASAAAASAVSADASATAAAASAASIGTTTGTGNIVRQTSPTLSTPIVSSGTANSVTFLDGSKVLTGNTALQFDGANLGLNVTPKAWDSTYRAMQLGLGGAIYGRTASSSMGFTSNVYVDASLGFAYINTAAAGAYIVGGSHDWYTAPSGTAGTAMTLTQRMNLSTTGLAVTGTLTASGAITNSAGTANGVTYLNGSKVLTSGSGLQFDGTNLGLGIAPAARLDVKQSSDGFGGGLRLNRNSVVGQYWDAVVGGDQRLYFAYVGTEYMVLSSTGLSVTGTLSATGDITNSAGTANGVVYLNGSKVQTSGSALTYDGTLLGISTSGSAALFRVKTTGTGSNSQAILNVFNSANTGLLVGTVSTGWSAGSGLSPNETYIWTNSAAALSFGVNTAEVARLTSTGFSVTGTLTASGAITNSAGTANGVTYLNASKVLTSGSGLQFTGTNLGIGTASPSASLHVVDTGAIISGGNAILGSTMDGAFVGGNGGSESIGLWFANGPHLSGISGQRTMSGWGTDLRFYTHEASTVDLTYSRERVRIGSGGLLEAYYGLSVTGAASATTTMRTGGYTVATLPAGSAGDRAYVTDATAPAYNTALTGGGAVVVPVFKNATVWVSC